MPSLIDTSAATSDGLPYWKAEQPTVAMVGATMLRYFPNAKKLQTIETFAGRGDYRRFGPRAVIDLDDLATSDEARSLLRSILDTIEDDSV